MKKPKYLLSGSSMEHGGFAGGAGKAKGECLFVISYVCNPQGFGLVSCVPPDLPNVCSASFLVHSLV